MPALPLSRKNGTTTRHTTCGVVVCAGAVFLVLFGQMTSVLRGLAGTTSTTLPQYQPQAAAAPCHHHEEQKDDNLPVYPLDQSDLSSYYVDPVAGVHLPNGPTGGERWIPVHDLFYDCNDAIMARYTPLSSSEVPKSSHYLSQEGEDQYVYRHFFSAAHTNNRPHYFIELGALDGKLFSNS